MNITTSILLLVVAPLAMYWMGRKAKAQPIKLQTRFEIQNVELVEGAEKLDHANWFGIIIGSIILVFVGYKMFWQVGFTHYFTPNNINLLLLGMGFLFHQSFKNFQNALEDAISGASGILIQFPLYFGIMGILRDSELIAQFSNFVASSATPNSFTYFTFFSAGAVNILVPSGGGQWAIQGPLLVQTANEIGAPLAKNILAFAYGDQLTNMLQPFWALPLLGITGLKAKEILPYTLYLFVIGLIIFLSTLFLF